MFVHFIIKNVTATFFNGNGGSIKGINNMLVLPKFHFLAEQSRNGTGSVTMRIGDGSFRDFQELEKILENPNHKVKTYKWVQRRGYKVAIFELV